MQAAQTEWTAFDGEHAWADYDVGGNVLARYLFGDQIDEIIARFRPGEGTAWYLTDHLGTIRDIVNALGQLINHIDYDSFGNILGMTNPAAGDRFTFTGREWDPELALYYYRARFYDPRLGRFTSQDPLGFDAGDPNLYRYVGNNPLGATDPSGMLAITECAIVRSVGFGVSVLCDVMEMWADDTLGEPEKMIALTQRIMLQALAFASPISGLAVQLTFQAITLKTTWDALAVLPGAGIYFAVQGVIDAYRHGQQTGDYRQFWVKAVCRSLDLLMLVWSARARCFVVGTPVVRDFAPEELVATANAEERSTLADVLFPSGRPHPPPRAARPVQAA